MRYLSDAGKKYEYFLTSTTATVVNGDKKYIISERQLTFKELAFIKAVKKSFAILPSIEKVTSQNVTYTAYNPIDVTGAWSNIDITAAYWNVAYKHRFINKELYERGNDNKQARLVALGSLATVRDRTSVV